MNVAHQRATRLSRVVQARRHSQSQIFKFPITSSKPATPVAVQPRLTARSRRKGKAVEISRRQPGQSSAGRSQKSRPPAQPPPQSHSIQSGTSYPDIHNVNFDCSTLAWAVHVPGRPSAHIHKHLLYDFLLDLHGQPIPPEGVSPVVAPPVGAVVGDTASVTLPASVTSQPPRRPFPSSLMVSLLIHRILPR